VPSPRDRLRRVRLWPEWYDQYPVRIDMPEYDVPRDIPTEELTELFGVPGDIVTEIDAWDREWQDIYRHDDPRESGFADEETMRRWYERGLRVARRLATEFGPGIPVEVDKVGGGSLVADPGQAFDYFGSIPPGRTRDRPGGVFRRTTVDGLLVDEAFIRNLRWEHTSALRERDLGYSDIDYVEITEAEAEAFVRRVTDKIRRDG
jgi:hypothetical protein